MEVNEELASLDGFQVLNIELEIHTHTLTVKLSGNTSTGVRYVALYFSAVKAINYSLGDAFNSAPAIWDYVEFADPYFDTKTNSFGFDLFLSSMIVECESLTLNGESLWNRE